VTAPDNREPVAGGDASSAKAGASNLKLRVVSAAVLAPLALATVYAGGWLFLAVCALAAAGILWEWTRLVAGKSDVRIMFAGLASLLAALLLTGLDQPGAAAAMVVIGALIAGGAVAVWPARYPAPNPTVWAVAGVAYAGVAFLGPALLRRDAELGLTALLFLAATVWITDIFAYAAGRAIGGPLLWPRVSPNKTWAGAAGGLAGGVAAGSLVAYASGIGHLGAVGIIALLLSVLTQAGDLAESAVKRRFGAKDASRLIPGHGGLMDRLDGFLVAALGALVIGILHHGADAPAQGLLLW
jgi:phosphatidate cytidylyltransferase